MSEQMKSSSMRYYHPKVIEHLASQYVLGTLTSSVHIRVEKIAKHNTELEQAILFWQQRFSPLDQQTAPLEAKQESWQFIAQHLEDEDNVTSPVANAAKLSAVSNADLNDTSNENVQTLSTAELATEHKSSNQNEAKRNKANIFERIITRLKDSTSFAMPAYALSFSLVFGILLMSDFGSGTSEDPLSYVAVLTEDNGQAHMVATTYGESRKLIVNMINTQSTTNDESLELWVVSKTDAQVRSLGVLPKNQTLIEQQLTVAEWRLIKDSESLIVTVEEAGGSAIGEPSDLIVSRGLCVRLQEWNDNA